jgi:hypothetical protein
MSGRPNRTTALELGQRTIAAVDQHLGNVASLTFHGATYTPDQLKAVLQAAIDGLKSVVLAQAQYRLQVAASKEASAKARALQTALKGYILSTYGASAVDVLTAFGIPVPKPRAVSAKTKAVAVDKAKATRVARHTMGAKQKQEIHGDVTPAKPTV